MGNQNKYKSGSIFDMQFITSSISTTLVLLLLGLVVFFVLTAHNLSVYVRENISFSVLISDDMKEADLSFAATLTIAPLILPEVFSFTLKFIPFAFCSNDNHS